MTPRYQLAARAERDLEETFKERHGRLVAEGVPENLLRAFDLPPRTDAPELWPPALSILGHGARLHRLPRRHPADSHRSDRARFATGAGPRLVDRSIDGVLAH